MEVSEILKLLGSVPSPCLGAKDMDSCLLQIDYLLIERALLGVLPPDELNSEEKDFCRNYKSVFEIGRMAERMAQGYYAHKAAIEVARDPRAKTLVSTVIRRGLAVPVGDVTRKDGTGHVYAMPQWHGS